MDTSARQLVQIAGRFWNAEALATRRIDFGHGKLIANRNGLRSESC